MLSSPYLLDHFRTHATCLVSPVALVGSITLSPNPFKYAGQIHDIWAYEPSARIYPYSMPSWNVLQSIEHITQAMISKAERIIK